MTAALLPSASHQASVLRRENPQFFQPVRQTTYRTEEGSATETREEDFRPRWWRAEEWDAR